MLDGLEFGERTAELLPLQHVLHTLIQDALQRALQSELDISLNDAEENMILGRWFVSECGGPSPAIARLSRKLYKLQGADAIPALMGIIQQVAHATSTKMSERQATALSDIKRAFHIK